MAGSFLLKHGRELVSLTLADSLEQKGRVVAAQARTTHADSAWAILGTR